MSAAPEPFGFTVRHHDADRGRWGEEPAGWSVTLPHQCDEWRIDADGAYADPTPHAVALAALDRFISEAIGAREALAERREFGNDMGEPRLDPIGEESA